MVGANTLLGQALRIDLPALARETGRWDLAPSADRYPEAANDDPLKEHDDPAKDARDGILSRDGGHFEAQFTSGAEAFADAAARLLRSQLPDLRFRVSIDGTPVIRSQVHLSTELPVLAPCEWTGRGLASAEVKQGNDASTVALGVAQRHETAKDAEDGKAADLVSLLIAKTRLNKLKRPQDLEELVGSGYLALIHADGNGVGSSAGTTDIARATSFHRNRVLLRRALHTAIEAHAPQKGLAPLVPLMLGGDDLLLLCKADIALPLVVTLCQALETLQPGNADLRLTLGVGVVIARPNIPIYRLHEVAEQLASSAKRRFRGATREERCSVVDWAVFSTAWVDDPEVVRRRDWLRLGNDKAPRVLSQRPVNVLGHGLLSSLQGLVDGADAIRKAPRSQLRYLVDQLPCGRTLSELAFAELPQAAKGPLVKAGVKAPWRRSSENGGWITELLDLVEIAEIARLGRAEKTSSDLEASHV